MKIVVLGTRGFPNVQGGVEKHCENLYSYLAQKGCDVTVLARAPYVDPSKDSYKGVRLKAISCPKNKFLETILHTLKGIFVAKNLKPDVLHIHAIGPCLCVPLARLLGLKVVITHHGPDYERIKWNALAKLVLKAGELFGCRFANDVITISKPIADHIKLKYNRIATIIPNGVLLPEPSTTDEALREFSIEKQKYILTVGRLVPEKGFHDIIDAFNLFQNRKTIIRTPDHQSLNSEFKLVIVGDADHKDEYSVNLKAKAAKTKNVIMTGQLPAKPLAELYSNAGLFVLPSYYEGLPIALLEAMSYGLSCLASDIPANRNIELDDNRFFQPGNIPVIADKINSFIQIPLTAEQKNKQTSLIQERYNWGKIADDTLIVYKKILRY